MTLEQKREIVTNNKDPAIAALEAVCDRIYDITDPLLDNEGQISEEKIGPQSSIDFLKTLREDAEKYEKLREKLMRGDFNLSLTEINLVGLAFNFCRVNLREQISLMDKAAQLADSIVKDLMSAEDNS